VGRLGRVVRVDLSRGRLTAAIANAPRHVSREDTSPPGPRAIKRDRDAIGRLWPKTRGALRVRGLARAVIVPTLATAKTDSRSLRRVAFVMVSTRMSSAAPWSLGQGVTAALLAAFIVACDLWVKVLARAAGCAADVAGASARVTNAYAAPGACQPVPLLGEGLSLHATSADGGPFGVLTDTLAGVGSLMGIAILAFTTVVTVLVWRWQWRSAGDPLALGALWGGALVLSAPRLHVGDRLTELALGSLHTGMGDLAFAWALGWLAWRAIAELRA
jgi:lipoprotein signal peptidase